MSKQTMTLKDACKQYIEHLHAIGKKPSTIGTVTRALDLLIADMGEAKEIANILPVHLVKFFKSEAATMQPGKDGPKPRAEASVLQIKRIVRQSIVWFHAQGWSEKVGLPEAEKRFLN